MGGRIQGCVWCRLPCLDPGVDRTCLNSDSAARAADVDQAPNARAMIRNAELLLNRAAGKPAEEGPEQTTNAACALVRTRKGPACSAREAEAGLDTHVSVVNVTKADEHEAAPFDLAVCAELYGSRRHVEGATVRAQTASAIEGKRAAARAERRRITADIRLLLVPDLGRLRHLW